eukprot:CAMPEP_0197434890 /NCGR_PEP_ID=MMETSP1175-20131217/2543_1 /TAXON_ID=1003142 /ORGANISM="Triceratium dubium, Strain CCMP147" /LENGTH=282 /DNA_ID=CAMNT_0042963753 /DNA_START=278 /DNA_END=1126 /DNA_ORIENTATION=-
MAPLSLAHTEETALSFTTQDEVVVGILGGVGPAAGLLLHQIILNNTENEGTDQGHVDVCHLSCSQDVPDRTNFLLQRSSDKDLANPAEGMARTLAMLGYAVQQRHSRAVAGVPCNTFHAPPIWSEFERLAKSQGTPVKLVHMLEETVRMIQSIDPNATKVGLMSTTGTRQSKVYHDLLEPLGYQVVQVDEKTQTELHDTIYNATWGIKSTAPDITPRAVENFNQYAICLAEQGAQVIIMGCTEIPFAFQGQDRIQSAILIDPMVALGRALLRESNPTKLKPL